MITLELISLIIITTYVIMTIIQEGEPYSISATYFKLKHKYLFGLTMISSAALLMPAILERTPENYQFTAFLALVGMIMVGVAPNFKDEFENRIHMTGAVMCVGFSQLRILLMDPVLLSFWGVYIFYTAIRICMNKGSLKERFMLTRPMFYVEITALIPTYLPVFVGQ